MKSMLIAVGYILLDSAIKRMLSGAGLALAVTVGLLTLTNNLINYIIQNLNSAPALMLNFIGISGIDVALSLVMSALIARATIMQAQVFLVKG